MLGYPLKALVKGVTKAFQTVGKKLQPVGSFWAPVESIGKAVKAVGKTIHHLFLSWFSPIYPETVSVYFLRERSHITWPCIIP